MNKAVLLLVAAVLVAAFFVFDLNQLLTLEGLKTRMDRFEALRVQSPVRVALVFFVIYVAVTALSLPGATIMSLAAGALFGLAGGTLLVSFASSIGATLAFLASRFLFRDLIQARFGERMRAINDGMAQDGLMYLFTLRLVPLFPFFLVNLLMGLTPIRTFSYYWISQLGMLAGTLVYINAGTELAKVSSLSGILSPGLVFSFVLLGLFPVVAKKFINFLQARRV